MAATEAADIWSDSHPCVSMSVDECRCVLIAELAELKRSADRKWRVRLGCGLAILREAAQSFCSRKQEDSRRTCMVCRQVRERQMTRLPDTLSPEMIHIVDRASEEEYRERCEAIVAVNESGNFQVVELDPDFREARAAKLQGLLQALNAVQGNRVATS